jgi:hypothetical protein
MKTLQVSDEVYEKLKAFVSDPFEDTPNNVLLRLMDIADKAKGRWCVFDPPKQGAPTQPPQQMKKQMDTVPTGTKIPDHAPNATEVVL